MRGVAIAGTHSGCGKTTVTLGILSALNKKKYSVQPFKAGPDFIDTGLHRLITGRMSRNLDLWMCGKERVEEIFREHSADADISVIEGVMGLYDGNLSTAHLAAALDLPVILVVDAYGMAESAGAVVRGFRAQGSGLGVNIAGVILNRIGSDRHYLRVKNSIEDIPVLGYLPRNLDFTIPHRHLGLFVAEESPIKKEEIDKLADDVLEFIDVDLIVRKCGSVEVRKNKKNYEKNSVDKTDELARSRACELKIGVAYDKAFCFYYEDNFDLLRAAGAEIVTFSLLADSSIPDDIDALYIGGGYPELYAKELSHNKSMLDSINEWTQKGMPAYAECGGFMYLTEGIYDFDGIFHPLVGTLPFKTAMKKGRAHLGYREITLKNESILGSKGDIVRGHEFHYSEIVKSDQLSAVSSQPTELLYAVKDGTGNSISDEGYGIYNTLGSYMHIHFGSCNTIAQNFINFIKEHHGTYTSGGTR
jgi:cobyrinic acid a,c-diamide synthase